MPVKNVKQRKIELRSKYKKLRENFSADKKDEFDKEIAERFINLPEYQNAETLFAFVSKDIEVNTEPIINHALTSGKKVAVPLCEPETRKMRFYYINSLKELKLGCYGIYEPDAKKCEKAETADLMIVPGLVFDKSGYRVGFGKGYYDRCISEFSGISAGICYSKCVEKELPRGFYDKPVNILITDKYTIDLY